MPLLERVGTGIGDAGAFTYGNELWTPEEYNVDLNTPQNAVQTYEKMRKSDGKVRSCINRLLYCLLAAEWRVDSVEKGNPEEDEIAEFVRSVLMPGEAYGYAGYGTWYQTLRSALLMTVHGYSVLEKIYGYRPSDGKQVIAAFEPRPAKTIWHFNLTDSGPSGLDSVTQWTQRKGLKTMPAANLVVLSFNREGDNWWGESILRPAHPHWRWKRSILGFDAIQKERAGGVFWVQSKENQTPSPEQIEKAKSAISQFRIHQNQAMYIPSVFELHAVFPQGNNANCLESAHYHDQQIESCMLSEWQSLGQGEKGARAVGEIQSEFMLYAYQGVANQVSDDFGAQAIKDLVDLNYGERERYPRLVCENFLQAKPDRLAQLMGPLVQWGVIRVDQPLRQYFRQKLAFPDEDPATLEPIPQQQTGFGGGDAAAATAQEPNARGERPPAASPAKAGTSDTKKMRKRAGAVGVSPAYPMRRPPLAHEQGVDWSAMRDHLDHSPSKLWYRDVLPIRQEQVKALAAAAGSASEAQLAQGQLPKPLLPELTNALTAGLTDSYRTGRRHVLEEAQRARVKKAASGASGDLASQYPAEPTSKQQTWIKRLAQGLALGMTLPMLQEAVRAGQQAQDQELPAEEVTAAVRSALEALSIPKVQSLVAGKMTQAYTTGRVEQGQAMQDEIATVFYSAMMDGATCPACEAMDGEELDPEDWGSQVPNPNCDGADGDNCRCAPVFVWRDQEQQQAA